MKLLSFAADGKEWFGALRDGGVVTLNDKVAQPNLRAALTTGAMETMRNVLQRTAPDRKLALLDRLEASGESRRRISSRGFTPRH